MRVAVVGMGNRVRGDDGAGPEVIRALRPELSDYPETLLLDGERMPENLLGEIQKFGPDRLIIVDAVDMGQKPGSVGLVDIHSVRKTALSTHKLPISMFLDYLQARMRFKLVFVGIQPRETGLNSSMSPEVRKAIDVAKELVKENISRPASA